MATVAPFRGIRYNPEAVRNMGKVIVPHLKKSVNEDKWKEQTNGHIKLLIATLEQLPDPKPTTEPAQPKPVAVEGVPAEVTDLAAALDSKDFRVRRDAQAKLLDMGAPVVPHLQKVIKAGKCSPTAQARMEQVINVLSPQRPDQIRARPGIRPVDPPKPLPPA